MSNNFAGNYAEKRLNNKFGGGNDRLSRDKKDADARLRGQIGTKKANKLIGAVDEIKYGYNSYRG